MASIIKTAKRVTLFLLTLLFLLSSIFLGLILYLQAQPLPDITIERTTFIYSSDGQVLDDIHSGENRLYVPISKIPDSLIDATVAIEDRKFYSHFGFDIIRIGGAIIEDIKQMSKAQGASTITQQLAKNLYLTQEKTWTRKFKEILLALQLELQFSKDEILEMYLNEIYYGHSANGVQLAANIYFGKDVSDLSLAESSMLAGIPKGPSYYSPFVDFETAKERQKNVLQAMVSENYITQAEADAAYNTELVFKDPNDKVFDTKAPYFRDYVIYQLKNNYSLSEEQIYSGGLKVYTTLDAKMQQYAEETIQEKIPAESLLQTALISIEPSTGYIKSMVGGRDYSLSQYNRVFANRQPGSTFKPVLYLAALENGFTPVTKYKSEPTIFTFENEKTYQPTNYGDSYPNKEVDLRYALTHSDNIYAVKTHLDIGMDKLVDMSERLGITTELNPYPSLALGSQEVSPFEITKAYSTIANQGNRVEPTAILKIEDHEGNIIFQQESIEEVEVASAQSTFILTYLMEGVFEPGGTGYYVADRLKRPIAGKTGTTDYDSWLIGYSPQLVTGLWMGYDDNSPLSNSEAVVTKEIWADYMEKAHKEIPPQFFMVPEGVTSLYIDPVTGMVATENCPNPRLEVFIEGTEPTEYCTDHAGEESIDNKQIELDKSDYSLWNRFKYWWNN